MSPRLFELEVSIKIVHCLQRTYISRAALIRPYKAGHPLESKEVGDPEKARDYLPFT